MKNPVIPYAIIAAIGILLVIVMSTAGLNQQEAIQDEEENGGENQEQAEDQSGDQSGESEGGQTASADAEEIFQSNCASCHGADLSGSVGPNLQAVGSKYGKDEIRGIIKNGFPDAQPPMPGGLAQGDEADALAQWLAEKK